MGSANRLAWAQGRAQRLMTDTATVVRFTDAPDGSGGTTRTSTTLGPYPCRLRASTTIPLEQVQAGRVVAVAVWALYLPHGTAIQPSDQIVVGGKTFETLDDGNDDRTDAAYQELNLRQVIQAA